MLSLLARASARGAARASAAYARRGGNATVSNSARMAMFRPALVGGVVKAKFHASAAQRDEMFFTCVVFGQVSISLLIDRFGWFEIQIRELSFSRILGVLLVIAGILLIQKEEFGLSNSLE